MEKSFVEQRQKKISQGCFFPSTCTKCLNVFCLKPDLTIIHPTPSRKQVQCNQKEQAWGGRPSSRGPSVLASTQSRSLDLETCNKKRTLKHTVARSRECITAVIVGLYSVQQQQQKALCTPKQILLFMARRLSRGFQVGSTLIWAGGESRGNRRVGGSNKSVKMIPAL